MAASASRKWHRVREICEERGRQNFTIGRGRVGLTRGSEHEERGKIGLVSQEPLLFDNDLGERITAMLEEAVDAEFQFAEDLLGEGVPGMSTADTRTYLEFVADQRLSQLGLPKRFNASNPFAFMELQDVQELSNFFERTVSAYQVGVEGDVAFDEDF